MSDLNRSGHGSKPSSPVSKSQPQQTPQQARGDAFINQNDRSVSWGPPFLGLEKHIPNFDFYVAELSLALHEKALPLSGMLWLPNGYPIYSRTETGIPIFHIAIRSGMPPPMIRKLVEHGAKIFQSDAQANNSLHWAIRWNWAAAESLFTQDEEMVGRPNLDGFTPLHLALIAFRRGLCTSSDLERLVPHDSCPSIDDVPMLPTGESPLEHLLETLSQNHDWSNAHRRMDWWKAVLSKSSLVPSLRFLEWVAGYSRVSEHAHKFPGTSIRILESLLKDLPVRRFSKNDLNNLAELGQRLLVIEDCEDRHIRVNLLIECQLLEVWKLNPTGIFDMMEWFLFVIDEGDNPTMICSTSQRTLLMKAIQDIKLSTEHRKYHPALPLVTYGCDAFQQEKNGGFPIIAAAVKSLQELVEAILEEDYLKTENAEIEGYEHGNQDGTRFYWPEWEEAKRTRDRTAAMALLSQDREHGTSIRNLSSSSRSFLQSTAMRVILQRSIRQRW